MIEDMTAERIGPEAVEQLRKTRLIEGIIEGKTATIAAIDAGYKGRDVRTPYKLIPADEMRRRFQEIAEKKGLTLDRIGTKILEHLDARANQTLEGKQVTQSEAPDYKVQQKALDQLTTLLGMGESSKVGGGVSGISVNITGPAADRLAALLGGE
jgi:hypothetical protein